MTRLLTPSGTQKSFVASFPNLKIRDKVNRYEETLKDVFVRKKICLPFMVSTRLLNQIDAARYENAPRDQRGVGDRPLEEPTKLVNELSNEKECKC